MHKSSTLFTGIFGAFVLSCGAMVLLPHSQIGKLEPQVQWEEGQNSPTDIYPVDVSQEGREVYQSQGCFYCHSQQVRDPQNGPDTDRGWGVRRTVARDYIYENAPMLGSTRLGPDFSNYGSKDWRNEPKDDTKKPAKRDVNWIFEHLYNPKSIVKDSKCPPYRFLFDIKKIDGTKSPLALNVNVQEGYEVLPTRETEHLAKYLLSLDRSHELKEAKTQAKPEAAKK